MEGPPARDQTAVGLRHGESGSRDDAVCEEAVVGLSLACIQQATGPGTTTIMRIVNNSLAGLGKGDPFGLFSAPPAYPGRRRPRLQRPPLHRPPN
jgi:hypothetical protein